MSTLVTGVPGTGKTAQVVSELKQLHDKNPEMVIYQHGIPDLKIPHVQTWCFSDACLTCREVPDEQKKFHAEKWFDYIKPGDVLVIDESQRIWPTRGPSKPRPHSVSMMEVHRKFGVKMYFMTQHPSLIDSDMRKHFRRHLHIEVNWKGRKLYEWDKCNDALRFTTARERPFKLPSAIFDLYKSAEAHVEINRNKPMSFYVALVCFSATIVYAGWFGYKHFFKDASPVQQSKQDSSSLGDLGGVMPKSLGGNESFPDFEPEIKGVPESAPAYRHLVQVKQAPLLAGCVSTVDSCKCYTQQATPYPVEWERCQELMRNLEFNPYVDSRADLSAIKQLGVGGPPRPVNSSIQPVNSTEPTPTEFIQTDF